MLLGLILYGFALVLLIYIIINIARTKKFETGDAIAALGIIVIILTAYKITPPSVPPLAPTITNTPSQKIPTQTPTPILLLNEQFDNPYYDGSKNSNLWYVSGENNPAVVTNTQKNGVLISTMSTLPSNDSEIHSVPQWQIKDVNSAEWRLEFDNTVVGDWASLAVGLVNEVNDRFVCDFKFYVGNIGLNCSIWDHGQNVVSVTNGNIPIQPNTWYILHISIINNPLQFNVYLDGGLVIDYVVYNPEPWESTKVHVYSSLSGDNIKNAITARIDYVVVTGK